MPQYIVECFIVTGFDDLDAIIEMNVDDGPSSTVHTIEQYIDKRKHALPQCMGPNAKGAQITTVIRMIIGTALHACILHN